MQKNIKIAYIGGGSKQWARVFMSDLAVSEDLSGQIALYDIDLEAAERNAAIGARINLDPAAKSHFQYTVCPRLEDALEGADFVVISILPGTFREMRSDVHVPEKYGIYQSVGDTAGPGGVLRAMRTVPYYEEFARKIRDICPNAWVLNFTNPMSICVKTLYDVFPQIKAFGCCHEVFHTQYFLTCVLKELKGIDADRTQIYTDACGINHFTWITEAKYQNMDLLALLPEFMDRFYEEGYYEGYDRFAFRHDPFAYGNKLKLDLFRNFGALAAAGDRHLAEFVSNVNLPNRGQMPQMPLGSIVETNCVFSNDQANPVTAKPLPSAAANLVYRCCANVDTCYEGIKERDLGKIFASFVNQPLCSSLTMEQCRELFREMCYNTREYLDPYFQLDLYFG